MSEPAWVSKSCTLPTTERPLRVAEWDALFAERLMAPPRREALSLRLDLAGGPGVGARIRDLAARESDCCSFLTFTTTPDGDLVHLDISVDAGHADVLDALAARTARAGESA